MDVIAQADNGNALLRFEPLEESDLRRLDPLIPCPLSLVSLWKDRRCLLVRNRFRDCWELPGGMIGDGESPRQAAIRELQEETNQYAEDLTLAGVALYQLGQERRREYGAVFTGRLIVERPFLANEEVTEIRWWDVCGDLSDLNELDATLIRLTHPDVSD